MSATVVCGMDTLAMRAIHAVWSVWCSGLRHSLYQRHPPPHNTPSAWGHPATPATQHTAMCACRVAGLCVTAGPHGYTPPHPHTHTHTPAVLWYPLSVTA